LFQLLLLLPIIDLLQQFEDYVKGIALQKRKKTIKACVAQLNTEPSKGTSHQTSVRFGKAVSEKKIFRNLPI
jgi:hypothetical protein